MATYDLTKTTQTKIYVKRNGMIVEVDSISVKRNGTVRSIELAAAKVGGKLL